MSPIFSGGVAGGRSPNWGFGGSCGAEIGDCPLHLTPSQTKQNEGGERRAKLWWGEVAGPPSAGPAWASCRQSLGHRHLPLRSLPDGSSSQKLIFNWHTLTTERNREGQEQRVGRSLPFLPELHTLPPPPGCPMAISDVPSAAVAPGHRTLLST